METVRTDFVRTISHRYMTGAKTSKFGDFNVVKNRY